MLAERIMCWQHLATGRNRKTKGDVVVLWKTTNGFFSVPVLVANPENQQGRT